MAQRRTQIQFPNSGLCRKSGFGRGKLVGRSEPKGDELDGWCVSRSLCIAKQPLSGGPGRQVALLNEILLSNGHTLSKEKGRATEETNDNMSKTFLTGQIQQTQASPKHLKWGHGHGQVRGRISILIV